MEDLSGQHEFVVINGNFAYLGRGITIITKSNGRYYADVYDEPRRVQLVSGTECPRSIVLSEGMTKQLVKALQNDGVRTETDEKRDGKLEATERHLADLRQMLKLK